MTLVKLSLAAFILAGLTGFLYRLSFIGFDFGRLNLANIRHAHSHLMFFSWAVPLPFYFIIRKLTQVSGVNGSNILMYRMAVLAALLGFVSWPLFFFYGYRPVSLGTLDLPLSVIISGLVMLCWYGFMVGYIKIRKHIEADFSLHFYDYSLLMLFISSLGAWGVAALQFADLANPLYSKSMTHFFLSSFTEGWTLLVLFGVLFHTLGIREQETAFPIQWGGVMILFGAPLTFPYGINEHLLTPELLWTARAGSLLTAAGLLWSTHALMRSGRRMTWFIRLIAGILVIKALVQTGVSIVPSQVWISHHGLRIFYLHLILLGGFTFGMFVGLYLQSDTKKGLGMMAASIVVLLASLLVYTPFWPAEWTSFQIFRLVALIALFPVLAAAYSWFSLDRCGKIKRPESRV